MAVGWLRTQSGFRAVWRHCASLNVCHRLGSTLAARAPAVDCYLRLSPPREPVEALSQGRALLGTFYQPPLLLTYSAQRSNPVMTVLGPDPRINPVISIGWLLNGIASFVICYG